VTVHELEFVFRRNSGTVLRRANELLGDPEAARDVLQDVFVRALNAQPKVSIEGTLSGWLYRTTTNLCLDRLRDSGRRRRILSRSEPCPVAGLDPGMDAQLTVRALLRFVPENMQTLVIHYFVDQMSQDEISSLTGIPRRTIGYQLDQFRARARALLMMGVQSDGPASRGVPGRKSLPSASWRISSSASARR
jgi:RNA polymerase sigma-70 factor, ECF subfamily